MCQLIISVIDKGGDDHWVKRGTVVAVLADDHAWGADELTHPMFRILRLPGAPEAFGRSFLGGEIPDHPGLHQPLYRLFKLDLDHPSIPADLAAHLADDSRAEAHHTIDPALLDQIKTRRSVAQPNVIGGPASIIG